VDATAESQRFEQAYTAAFQPCQAWLNEQAAIRRTNLDARRQVLERVLAFEAGLDAEHPDHPLIMRVLREAPQEWRNHAPVDRDASRPLDAEFFSALDRLRARVNAWYAANTADKQALMARASQLATAADLSRAIDEVKRLQAQWKDTGPVPHAQSQSMWEEFRALCNAVYERRQQEFAQQNAVLEQTKSAAEELCRQIEQGCQEGPADRPSGEARLREWQEAFNALGELPRSDARSLHERYQRAMAKFDAQIAGLAQRALEAAEANVLAAARHVRAYQRAVIEGDAAREELKTAAAAFLAGVPRWPSKAIPQALRQSLARADSAEFMQADDAARELALRKLCIHAEILSDTATPPEDAGLRREQEMQLLRQGLGQARQADDRSWEAMRLEWLGLAAAEPAVHDELERRFMRCLKRRGR
jgi:exonuclease SbcC